MLRSGSLILVIGMRQVGAIHTANIERQHTTSQKPADTPRASALPHCVRVFIQVNTLIVIV